MKYSTLPRLSLLNSLSLNKSTKCPSQGHALTQRVCQSQTTYTHPLYPVPFPPPMKLFNRWSSQMSRTTQRSRQLTWDRASFLRSYDKVLPPVSMLSNLERETPRIPATFAEVLVTGRRNANAKHTAFPGKRHRASGQEEGLAKGEKRKQRRTYLLWAPSCRKHRLIHLLVRML